LKNNTYFAVKELKTGYKADREAVALKRFHDKRHPHLIRLLATYTYRGHFNLLFPWADGNLKEFWKVVQPPALEAFQQAAVARWMSAQILGLAQALEVIHYCEIDKANVHNFTADQIGKTHGRHGDLKPENILWFNENESGQQKTGEDPMGVLQIGDLGLADFHSKHSKSIVPPSAVDGVTETYSAPELYVAQRVSPQFDIWSFGCILLQFVVWYIHGWTGIDEFAEARIRESKGFIFPLDNFYSLDADGTHAYVKNSVAKVG
jgi:serine/threonine protein kinase